MKWRKPSLEKGAHDSQFVLHKWFYSPNNFSKRKGIIFIKNMRYDKLQEEKMGSY